MKSKLFLLILGLCLIGTSYTPAANNHGVAWAQDEGWGAWSYLTGQVDWRIRLKGYNETARKYHWEYQFRNQDRMSDVTIVYTIYSQSEEADGDRGAMDLAANGGTQQSWGLFISDRILRIRVTKFERR